MKGAKITITEYNVYDVYLNRSYNVFLVSVSIAIEQLSHLKVAKTMSLLLSLPMIFSIMYNCHVKTEGLTCTLHAKLV